MWQGDTPCRLVGSSQIWNCNFNFPKWLLHVAIIKIMTVKFNKRTLEIWWALLAGLSTESKLELAARLINSLKENAIAPRKKDDGWLKLAGAWKDEESVEEMANRIRSSRFTNRQIEPFD